MRFAESNILYLIVLLPLIGLGLFWLQGLRSRALTRFAGASLLSDIVLGSDAGRDHFKNALLLLVVFFSIFALARPQWGFQWQEVKRQGLDIILAIDVSKSMLTQDVKPDRLGRTKLAVRDLIQKLNSDRAGLIAFAGEAFLVCPLTVDYGGFLLSLDDLDTATIPRGGTNLASAIEEAIKEYDATPSRYKAVVLLTDGESLEGDPLKAAGKAKQKGIKIYCVGIGTPEGELVQVLDANGQKSFLKDEQGNFVKSRLNEKLLQQVALATGGIYVRASGAQFGLDIIYDRELGKLEKREITAKMEKRYYERFQWPLALAFLFLLAETILPQRRSGKIS